jgi:hypothetical protein
LLIQSSWNLNFQIREIWMFFDFRKNDLRKFLNKKVAKFTFLASRQAVENFNHPIHAGGHDCSSQSFASRPAKLGRLKTYSLCFSTSPLSF